MATVDGVTKANVLTRTYNAIVDILGDNVTDPLSRSSDSDWIKRGSPNPNDYITCKGGSGWQFPLIVVEVNTERTPLSVDRSQTRTKEQVTVDIEVMAIGTNATSANQQRDEIAEDVIDALYANAASLSTGTLQNVSLVGTSNDVDFIGNKKVRIKRMTFTFQRVD